MVKKAITGKITRDICEEAENMKTLQFLSPVYVKNEHHSVVSFPKNPREVTRSNIMLRLLTGTYTLQASQQKFGKVHTDTCQMCRKDKEDIPHFVTTCEFLQLHREP